MKEIRKARTTIVGIEAGMIETTINIKLTKTSKEIIINILKAKTQNTGMIIITHIKTKITKNMIQSSILNIKLKINMTVPKIMIKDKINKMPVVRIFIENIGLSLISEKTLIQKNNLVEVQIVQIHQV